MTFANCRNPKNREVRIFFDELIKKANYMKKNQIIHSSQNNYIGPSENDPLITYNVNLEASCCSCSIGKYGKLCKYQCAVYIHTMLKCQKISLLLLLKMDMKLLC